MTAKTLILRVSRRAVAAAMLDDEELTFFDGRHLSSRKDRALPAATRYVERIVSLTSPTEILVDGPSELASTTASVLEAVRTLGHTRGLQVRLIDLSEVLQSFGQPGLPSRVALRAVIDALLPQVASLTRRVKPYIADAAAVALYAESTQALSPIPT